MLNEVGRTALRSRDLKILVVSLGEEMLEQNFCQLDCFYFLIHLEYLFFVLLYAWWSDDDFECLYLFHAVLVALRNVLSVLFHQGERSL